MGSFATAAFCATTSFMPLGRWFLRGGRPLCSWCVALGSRARLLLLCTLLWLRLRLAFRPRRVLRPATCCGLLLLRWRKALERCFHRHCIAIDLRVFSVVESRVAENLQHFLRKATPRTFVQKVVTAQAGHSSAVYRNGTAIQHTHTRLTYPFSTRDSIVCKSTGCLTIA